MALNINPVATNPSINPDKGNANSTVPNGAPNQDAANQLASLLNPAQGSDYKASPAPSPFANPFIPSPKGNGIPIPQSSTPSQITDGPSESQSKTVGVQTAAIAPHQGQTIQNSPEGTLVQANTQTLNTSAQPPQSTAPAPHVDKTTQTNQLAEQGKATQTSPEGKLGQSSPQTLNAGAQTPKSIAPVSEAYQITQTNQPTGQDQLTQATPEGTLVQANTQTLNASAQPPQSTEPVLHVDKTTQTNQLAEQGKATQTSLEGTVRQSIPQTLNVNAQPPQSTEPVPHVDKTTQTNQLAEQGKATQPSPEGSVWQTSPQEASLDLTEHIPPSTTTQGATMPTSSIGSNSVSLGNLQQGLSSDESGAGKVGARPSGLDSLSDAQLLAAASLQAAAHSVNPAVSSSFVADGEEVSTQPSVNGEKIQALMDSVTKELGMRDLSQLKLGGEMTIKLDQGALPNTEIKVRFDGNEMIIIVDSQSADVNQFCTDNLILLQQSISSGVKEEMKVRVEIRNPPDLSNQQQRGGGGQGNGGGSSSEEDSSGKSGNQSQANEGDSSIN